MRILDLQRRLREIGRIRIGEQVATQNGRSRPAKLEHFRLTSRDQAVIAAAAEKWGGTVEPWTAPDGQQWEVKTNATELAAVVPPGDMSFSQSYEVWSAGGCKVRCDGRWDVVGDRACHCDPAERTCDIHTRLSVILPDLPGLGVWRLDTQGYYAAVELGGVVDLAAGFAERGQMLPARLRLEQRSVKRLKPDGKSETRRFVVPVLDLDVHPMALTGGVAAAGELERGGAQFEPVPPSLPSGPPAGTVSEQVQQLEEPKATRPRKNAAAPIPSTGTAPRTAREVSGQEVAPPAIPRPARPPAISAGRPDETEPKMAAVEEPRLLRTIAAKVTEAWPCEDAPRGTKTKARDRIRYTLTHGVTKGRTVHLDELTWREAQELDTLLDLVQGGQAEVDIDGEALVVSQPSGFLREVPWVDVAEVKAAKEGTAEAPAPPPPVPGEAPAPTAAAEGDGPHTWDVEAWKVFIKDHGQKVVATMREAQRLAGELGVPFESLADLAGDDPQVVSLAALVQAWVLEQEGGS